MKCRNTINNNVVWFNRISKHTTSTNVKDYDNYVEDTDAVVSSLTQRLSVIKGELWYQINYGLPLLDNIKSKSIFDSVIINIIISHPGVRNIENYTSTQTGHNYAFTAKIISIYNEELTLSNTY